MVEGNSGEVRRETAGLARMVGGVFVTALALWSGIWLAITALLEWWYRGFVVHHMNTRSVWLVFAATGTLYLFLKTKEPHE